MGIFDEYLPSVPNLSEVGELMAPLPSLPSLPSISEVGEIGLPSFPELPSLAPMIPSISEVGELSVPLPSLPSMPSLPSISEVGEIGLPSLPSLPSMPVPIAEVGELTMPDLSRSHTPEEMEQLRAAGAREAERGLSREGSGDNVVGMAGDTGVFGEDGSLFPYLFGDNPEMQQFGRLHDVEAAMAEQESGGGMGFTIANMATAAVGGAGTAVTDAETGAAMANALFETLGYTTGDYAEVQGETARRHQA